MRILILHQTGKRASMIQKRLRYEQIESEILNVNSLEWSRFREKVANVHALILYIKSPMYKEPLLRLPQIIKKCKLPIVCLDEKDDTESELLAKQYDVALYYPAPFSFPEIALKLKLMIYKKIKINGEYKLKAGDICVDFLAHQIKRGSEYIPLRGKELALMEFLMLNRGKALTRNMILEQVWDRNASILSNTVDVHISRLRRKLETGSKKYFHTLHSFGYKFDPRKREKVSPLRGET